MADDDEHLGRTVPRMESSAENAASALQAAQANSSAIPGATYKGYEAQGTAYDSGARGYEAQGRDAAPPPDKPAPPRTIVSGVERLDALKVRAAEILHDADLFVRGMEGKLSGDNGAPEWKWSESPDTAGKIHDAVFDMEGLFKTLADTIARAKAAHG